MKTTKDTTELAGLIQSFLLPKGHNVARCDALELAARIRGARDLHHDQSKEAVCDESRWFPNEDAKVFFQILGLLVTNGSTVSKAIVDTESCFAEKHKWVWNFLVRRVNEEGLFFGDALAELNFPSFVVSLVQHGMAINPPGQAFGQVATALENSRVLFPTMNLRVNKPKAA